MPPLSNYDAKGKIPVKILTKISNAEKIIANEMISREGRLLPNGRVSRYSNLDEAYDVLAGCVPLIEEMENGLPRVQSVCAVSKALLKVNGFDKIRELIAFLPDRRTIEEGSISGRLIQDLINCMADFYRTRQHGNLQAILDHMLGIERVGGRVIRLKSHGSLSSKKN